MISSHAIWIRRSEIRCRAYRLIARTKNNLMSLYRQFVEIVAIFFSSPVSASLALCVVLRFEKMRSDIVSFEMSLSQPFFYFYITTPLSETGRGPLFVEMFCEICVRGIRIKSVRDFPNSFLNLTSLVCKYIREMKESSHPFTSVEIDTSPL